MEPDSIQFNAIIDRVRSCIAAAERVVIANAAATPFDDIADALLREPIGKTLPRILDGRGGAGV